jgi:hypothetical protein
MSEAWDMLCNNPAVTVSVDLFHCGCFFSEKALQNSILSLVFHNELKIMLNDFRFKLLKPKFGFFNPEEITSF